MQIALLFSLMISLRPHLQNMTTFLQNFKMRITEMDESLNKLGHDIVQGYLHVSVLHRGDGDRSCRILSGYY